MTFRRIVPLLLLAPLAGLAAQTGAPPRAASPKPQSPAVPKTTPAPRATPRAYSFPTPEHPDDWHLLTPTPRVWGDLPPGVVEWELLELDPPRGARKLTPPPAPLGDRWWKSDFELLQTPEPEWFGERELMGRTFGQTPRAPLLPRAPHAPLAPLAPTTPPPAIAPHPTLTPFGEDLHAVISPEAWSPEPGDGRPRAPWLRQDPGDSLYRSARELLNGGEYRRAAGAFRELSTRMPTSGYAPDAHYWWAFALYRIGGTDELRQAIEVLDTQKSKYPGAKMLAQSDALSLRIRGALASRGDVEAARTIRTAAGDSALRCDREEQSVQVEALNALTQSDPDGAMPVLQKILARTDTCSAALRHSAVFLIGNKRRDAGGVTILARVARTDPSFDVRGAALQWLARAPGDDALNVLEELARDSSEERLQRASVRALVSHPSARARQVVRGIVERESTPERLRLEALSAFDKERSSSEDVTWMRTLYGRTENARVKARIVSTLSNIGGPEVDQWMLAMARNTEERSDTRRYAVRRVGKTLPIAELAKLYDASAERAIRETLIETLGQRAEGEATDKLLDIVKSGTDPQLRSRAISALTSKKDPRTLRLLMEIIDK